MKIEILIKEIINEVIAYSKVVNETDISVDSFAEYLKRNNSKEYKEILNLRDHPIDQEIIVHLGRLNRYANLYLKDSLSESPFKTIMDFAFCAILHQYGPLSKMELIRKMVYEKSSGMEIIKRLLKDGIFQQMENPEDKRSKLLFVSPYGEEQIFKAYKMAGPAATVVSLPLSELDKISLLKTLNSLDDFHLNYFLKGNNSPIDIMDDYKKSNQ